MDSFVHPQPIILTHGDNLVSIIAQLQPSSTQILVVRNQLTLLIFDRSGPYPQLFYERQDDECYYFTDRDNNEYVVFGETNAQLIHRGPLIPADLLRVKIQDQSGLFIFVAPNYNNEVRKRSPPRWT